MTLLPLKESNSSGVDMSVDIFKKCDLQSFFRGDIFVNGKRQNERPGVSNCKEHPLVGWTYYLSAKKHMININSAGLRLLSITRYCLLCTPCICILAYFSCHPRQAWTKRKEDKKWNHLS